MSTTQLKRSAESQAPSADEGQAPALKKMKSTLEMPDAEPLPTPGDGSNAKPTLTKKQSTFSMDMSMDSKDKMPALIPADAEPPKDDKKEEKEASKPKPKLERKKTAADIKPKGDEGVKLINHENFEQFAERVKKTAAGPNIEKLGFKAHHGINIPIFALKSETSAGIGEYMDLMPLMDWCKETGYFDIIQTLPLNDTNNDNGPFGPTSCFSLNPYFLSFAKLPFFDKSTDSMKATYEELKKLNSEVRVQWTKIRELKKKWLLEYAQLEQVKDMVNTSSHVKEYLESNKDWLPGYGLFMTLKEKNGWKSWEQWEGEEGEAALKENRKEKIDALYKKYADQIAFSSLLQFLCWSQMTQVKKFGEDRGIFLKGDIPFLVGRDSADVWLNRDQFRMEMKTGAPPDAFSDDGQDWGLPLYNWEEMEKDGFAWWKRRLQVAAQYYHIFRIDHIVGFFRVWAIPEGKSAKEGSFYPEDPEKWVNQGRKLLAMALSASSMVPIGEDLGTVPMSVRKAMQDLGISGTKVLRWERDWEADGKPFIPTAEFNRDSMTTLSTHDTTTLTLWWRDSPEDELKDYCAYKKWDYTGDRNLSQQQRMEILKECHTSPSLFHINLLSEYTSLVPQLSYDDPQQERINFPGTVQDSNWSNRMKTTLEEMTKNEDLKKHVQELKETKGL